MVETSKEFMMCPHPLYLEASLDKGVSSIFIVQSNTSFYVYRGRQKSFLGLLCGYCGGIAAYCLNFDTIAWDRLNFRVLVCVHKMPAHFENGEKCGG